MAMSLLSTAPAQHFIGRNYWPVSGTWTFREATGDVDDPGPTRSSPMRSGVFRARQDAASKGDTWELELEEIIRSETSLTAEALDGSGLATPGASSGRTPAEVVKKSGHRELMALLKWELEIRYGRAGELQVLFQQVHPLFPPRRPLEQERWWDRIWNRLAGS